MALESSSIMDQPFKIYEIVLFQLVETSDSTCCCFSYRVETLYRFVIDLIFSQYCRRYCTARLRRLYKSLKFTHGRGKYAKKALTESTVTEVRYALVMVFFYSDISFWCLFVADLVLNCVMEGKNIKGIGSIWLFAVRLTIFVALSPSLPSHSRLIPASTIPLCCFRVHVCGI